MVAMKSNSDTLALIENFHKKLVADFGRNAKDFHFLRNGKNGTKPFRKIYRQRLVSV